MFKAPLRFGFSLGRMDAIILRTKVRFFTTLRELAGTAEDEIELEDGASLAELIGKVALKYGKAARDYLYHDSGEIDPSIYFLVNGKDSKTLSGRETRLEDGDTVAIIPPIGGGQHMAMPGFLLS